MRSIPPFITGLDGKKYPSTALTTADRELVIGHCHYLRHNEGMSIRAIQEHLCDEHEITRSVGSVAKYLREPCVKCSGDRNDPPEQMP